MRARRALKNGHTSHHLPWKKVEEIEESMANLTTVKIGDEGGSGTADHVEGQTADLGAAVATSACTGKCESGCINMYLFL